MRTFKFIKSRFFAAFIFFLLSGIILPAQQIHLSLDKDTISYNENVVLTLSGETGNQNMHTGIPSPDGVMVVGTNETTSFNSSSGKTKFTRTYTLSPYEIGTFTFGPAWAQVGSHRFYSNKVTLVIKPGNKSSKDSEIFLRCESDKKKVVLGEQITLSLMLYSRVERSLGSERPIAKTFNGFWYHEGAPIQRVKDTLVFVNGLPYQRSTIYKEYVFPNVTGKLSIPAYTYTCFIKQNPYPTGDPLIDDVMSMPTQIELTSPENSIEVLPVSKNNQPANFKGDVGEFSLSATIDHDKIKANEPVILKVSIRGIGNINFIQFPPTQFPDGIENFAPVSNDTTSVTEKGIEGEKTFSVTLIPKNKGKFTIPGISFSYFDPRKKEFITLHTPEFPLTVEQGDTTKDISENNLPESFLDATSNGKNIFKLFLISIPLLALILVLFFIYRKKKKKNVEGNGLLNKNEKTENEEPILPQKKSTDIQAMINVAEHFFISGNTKTGIAQLYESLLTALCEKTELSREEASINQLRFRLELKNYSKEFTSEILALVVQLSELRYSSVELSNQDLFEKLGNTKKLTLLLKR